DDDEDGYNPYTL
nr:Chain B, Poly(A) RNA polymerase protein 2 [Saccharomyces cerevisiae]